MKLAATGAHAGTCAPPPLHGRVTVTVAWPSAPVLSHAVTLITCVPCASGTETEIELTRPSMRCGVVPPSICHAEIGCADTALALSVTGDDTVAPFCGAVMVTVTP